MSVIKLTSSKKAIQVVDDEGRVYGTSTAYLQSLLAGTLKNGYILLKRMPFNVAPDRFKKSELWVPEGQSREYIEKQLGMADELTTNSDPFSVKEKKKRQQKKAYRDIDI